MSLAEISFVLPTTETNMPLAERIAQLVAERGYARVGADDADAFGAQGASVLLLVADPRNNPESWDALIVLPELLDGFKDALRAGIVAPPDAAQLALRYGVRAYPSLVFLRDGGYVGAIEGLQDWEVYVRRTRELLAAPVGRAPSLGIPVTRAGGDAPTCH